MNGLTLLIWCRFASIPNTRQGTHEMFVDGMNSKTVRTRADISQGTSTGFLRRSTTAGKTASSLDLVVASDRQGSLVADREEGTFAGGDRLTGGGAGGRLPAGEVRRG